MNISTNLKFVSILLILVTLYGCARSDKDNEMLQGHIYFEASGSLFRLNTQNDNIEKLMNNASQPDVQPDGNIVALEGGSTGRIITTDLYGTNRRTIVSFQNDQNTPHQLTLNAPKISYDQKFIAYDSYPYRHVTYIVDAITGALQFTIGTFDNSADHYFSPSWAPDGSLFLQGGKSTNNGIYKVDKDFTSITRIDPFLSNIEFPAVSPDGTKIAFIKDFELWIMDIDGSNPTNLNTNLASISRPSWSPDSENIAVIDYTTIYIINIINLTIEPKAENVALQYSLMCWN